MKIRVYWKDIEFLEVEKVEDKYFSMIIMENYKKVKEEGCPVMFVENIKIVDDKLPHIIQSRLPKTTNLISKLGDGNKDIESSIIEYINKTKCKRATDYITLDIE